MDHIRAKRMTKELIGTLINGWTICDFLGAGKSALVFRAEKEGNQSAMKVFDPELVERFGKKAQLGRIDRERSLINESHPNLVKIYDGGECSDSGFLYVAMEFLKARNMEEALLDIPRENIASLISQVAAAAKFLEDNRLAHRDIKPSNIAVTDDFSKAVLLDLGVLRPFGNPGLTDEDARVFVGTLQYSSPEFLLRAEEDLRDDWRAITFYQIGGVLHDLIMKKKLFQEFSEPFAMLVEAVKSEQPQIHADDVSEDLILLSQNCLTKSPVTRLSLVTWKDFDETRTTKSSAENARERVTKRSLHARSVGTFEDKADVLTTPNQSTKQVVEAIDRIIHLECAGNASFPRMQIVKPAANPNNVRVEFDASSSLSVPRPLSILFICRMVDAATMAIQVNASACLLAKAHEHTEATSTIDVFRGALDSPSLASRIHDYLYLALDAAQSSDHRLFSADDPVWLSLKETGE